MQGVGDMRFDPQAKLAMHEKFRRFVNGEKVYPVNLEISPSHVCNAQCEWCFYAGTHLKAKNDAFLDTGIATNLIYDAHKLGIEALTWTGGGEPTLHPDFDALTRTANGLGLKQGLFTNALNWPRYFPLNFEWIRVSNTNKAWPENNIGYLREHTRVLGMALNYIGDDKAVDEAIRVGKKIGVDYVQIRQALNLRGHVTERTPPKGLDKIAFVTEYKFEDSQNPHGYTECYGFNFVPFIWHNGNVDVCGYHPKTGGRYTLGNLKERSLKEIIDFAPRHVPVIDSCQVCCKNHEANKLINRAKKLEDRSFI